MTCKVTIEVPTNVNYRVEVSSRSTGIDTHDNIIEKIQVDGIVKAGEKYETYVWKGHELKIREISNE